MIGALITVAAFSLIGAAVQRLLGGGARFLLGVGTVGLVLYIALLVHLPAMPVLVVLVVAALVTLVVVRRERPRMPPPRMSVAATVVTVAPVLLLLYVSAIKPLADYDGRAFWLLKAKAIAAERQVDGPFFDGARGHNPKNEYPLLVPVAAASVMIAAGDLDDSNVRWIYVLALGSLALHARKWLGAWPAALITWIPQFAVRPDGGALSAYNDVLIAAFAACAFFELVDRSSPARLGLWISFLALTKNEGLPFALLLFAAAVVVWRGRAAQAVPSVAVSLAVLFAWRSRVAPTDDDPLVSLLPTLPENLERFAPAVSLYVAHAMDPRHWGFFWPAVVVSAVLLATRRRWADLALPSTIIAGMSAVYIAAYMVTSWPFADHIAVSADRLLMHLIGPALYLIAMAVAIADRAGEDTRTPQSASQ